MLCVHLAKEALPMMKKSRDLEPFKFVLPYASEIFGVYQPLIGWRGRRIIDRIEAGFLADKARIVAQMFKAVSPAADVELIAERGALAGRPAAAGVRIKSIHPGAMPAILPDHESFLVDEIRRKLPPQGEETPATWDKLLDEKALDRMLNTEVKSRITDIQQRADFQTSEAHGDNSADVAVLQQVARESRVARYLLEVKQSGQTDALTKMFYGTNKKWIAQAAKLVGVMDPLDFIDPNKDLGRVTLSPISIVHLFRQYFFEFDTFLGTPVSHVWLSPGSSVELVEIQTRRVLTEKTFEAELTTTTKVEKETVDQDELSESVKESNRDNTAFGFNTSVHQGWVGGSADASASINLENTQEKARETSHKHMRQQTEKVSTEIRQNYKSTFKTVSEVTDTSSKRYVLNNTTDKLINYELRRKMRQVGVQVQDIGTYLCWQTFVDDPGRQLGVSELVHIAKSPETGNRQPPQSVLPPEPYAMKSQLTIPFKPRGEDTNEDDMDESYHNGKEVDTDTSEGERERIDASFRFPVHCDKANYVFDAEANTVLVDVGGNDMEVKVKDIEGAGNEVKFTVYLKHVNFHDQPSLIVTATTFWVPDPAYVGKINAENAANVAKYNAETQREFEKAYVEAARERIKLASEIVPRKFEDLREEERIVVYRMLIQDMLTKDLPLKDNRTRHAVAELLNSIFDVDKMLYFVAPEWWRPRLHRSHQTLGTPEKPPAGGGSGGGGGGASVSMNFASKSMHNYAVAVQATPLESLGLEVLAPKRTVLQPDSVVGWGGEGRQDNYYITDESQPAKLGSSLGWLLQLDGDNQRNTFLNAPWVKAIIPIRPGKEKAAFNWLQRVNVEGADGLDALYSAPAAELAQIPHSGPNVTIKDAINHLCTLVEKKHEDSMKVAKFPTEEINDDNKVSATPVDKVYEHGFYPNEGGFKLLAGGNFEVFDQWIEILPTDQIVPVEVQYDPITGRQVQIVEDQ
jgi:hypothetical protein